MRLTLLLVIITVTLVVILFMIASSGLHNKDEKHWEGKSFLEWRRVIKGRLTHARNYCKTDKRRSMGKPNIFWDENSGVAYCANAKAGTARWIRLLFNSRMQNETHSEAIHKAAEPYLTRSSKSVRYLFLACVRHPYKRLVSAYLEKIPANYRNISDDIIRNYRKERTSEMEVQQKLIPGIDLTSTPSFSEFVKYVLQDLSDCGDEISDCLYSIDVHWRPQVERCSPCTISFNFIAKIETLKYDLEYLKELLWNRNKYLMDLDDVSQIYHRNKYGNEETESKLISSLSQDERMRIYDAYRADFLAFDYSPYIY